MINKEKLIKDLDNTINTFYVKSNMKPSELFKFRDELNEIIDNIKKGHYDASGYHDVAEFYKE